MVPVDDFLSGTLDSSPTLGSLDDFFPDAGSPKAPFPCFLDLPDSRLPPLAASVAHIFFPADYLPRKSAQVFLISPFFDPRSFG